jgi:hypothetical protein
LGCSLRTSAGQREIADITGATSQNWKLERFLRGRPDASIVIKQRNTSQRLFLTAVSQSRSSGVAVWSNGELENLETWRVGVMEYWSGVCRREALKEFSLG